MSTRQPFYRLADHPVHPATMGVAHVTCRYCDGVTEFVVWKDDYEHWRQGSLIQRAMPYLPVDKRELLISRTCGPCFDKMWETNDD